MSNVMKCVAMLLLTAACGSVSGTPDAGGGSNAANVTVTVTVEGTGTGHVTSMPAGIDCPGICSANFPASSEVTLTAAPDSGMTFAGYTGNCTGFDVACVVTASSEQNVTAKFVKSGEKRFAKQISEANLSAVTIDKNGKIIIAGTVPGQQAMYISARQPSNGALIWESTIPYFMSPSLVTAPNGDIVLMADLVGSPSVAGRLLNYAGGIDAVVARVSASSGTVTWAQEIGSPGYDDVAAVAVSADNTIYIGGSFSSTATLTIGTTTLSNGGSNSDAWMAAFNADNSVRWAKDFGTDAGGEGITGLSVDGDNNPIVSGIFNTTITFGTNLTYTATSTSSDIFIARLRANDGGGLTGKQLGSTMGDSPDDVEKTADGGYVVTGGFTGTQTFGGANLTDRGGGDVFIARFTAAGAHTWSTSIGGTSSDRALDVTLDSKGGALIAGYYNTATMDFGGGHTLANAGQYDGYLLKLDATGAYAWSQHYGGTSYDYGNAVAVDALDNAYVVGTFTGTAAIGDDSFMAATANTSSSYLVSYWP